MNYSEERFFAPIVIFSYNRVNHLKNCIEALKKNIYALNSELYIYSDGAKINESSDRVEAVRDYIKTIGGFKKITVIERETNLGLANNIIDGVTNVVNIHGRVIVLEDDLVTSPFFLSYMNTGLDLYENEEQVISIHSYIYPIKEELPDTFFIKGADCLGWGTWKRGWDLFDKDGSRLLNQLKCRKLEKEFNFNNSYPYIRMLKDQIDGKNQSWAVRWYASAFLKSKLTLYPGVPLVIHTGFDGSGTHCGKMDVKQESEINNQIRIEKIPIIENKLAKNVIIKYFKGLKSNLLIRVVKKIGKITKLY